MAETHVYTRKEIVASLQQRKLKTGAKGEYVKDSYRLWGMDKDVEGEVLALAATDEMLDQVLGERLKEVARKVMRDPPKTRESSQIFLKALKNWIKDPDREVAKGVVLRPRTEQQKQEDEKRVQPPLPPVSCPVVSVPKDRAPVPLDSDKILNAVVSEDSVARLKELETHYAKSTKPGDRYYNYLLLDPAVFRGKTYGTENPPTFAEFLSSIFYVGKGVGSRVYKYYEAAYNPSDSEYDSPKLRRIRSLWEARSGYIVFRFSYDISENLALDQEAAAISGLILAGRALTPKGENRDGDAGYLCNRSLGTPKFSGRLCAGNEKGEEVKRLWKSQDELAYSRHVLYELGYRHFLEIDKKTGKHFWEKIKYPHADARAHLQSLKVAVPAVSALDTPEKVLKELSDLRENFSRQERELTQLLEKLTLKTSQ